MGKVGHPPGVRIVHPVCEIQKRLLDPSNVAVLYGSSKSNPWMRARL